MPSARRPLATFAIATLAAFAAGCTTISERIPETLRTLAAVPGPSAPPDLKLYRDRTLYSCCNLHHARMDIPDINYTSNEIIPAGTVVRVIEFDFDGRNWARVEIDGKHYRIIHEQGVRAGETFQQYLDKVLLREDPRAQIAAYPPAVREAIRIGRIVPGMTRQQVIAAIGHPPMNETRDLAEPIWAYRLGRFDPFEVVFDAQGRVKEIAALTEVRKQVLAPSDANGSQARVAR
jgi:hypothetical protein